ncbi:hypothetical protein ACIF83_36075 [Streptomyces sp. NPDC085866]|uniref:hypothetical protein n=1 Tax=Streptomyces sp. NPDC085866 TaxID=3365736 RepID=UPI0037D6CD47
MVGLGALEAAETAVRARSSLRSDGFVARLAYQQTKITGRDPPTIPVDQEIVDIIRLQQEWAREFDAAWAPRRERTPATSSCKIAEELKQHIQVVER